MAPMPETARSIQARVESGSSISLIGRATETAKLSGTRPGTGWRGSYVYVYTRIFLPLFVLAVCRSLSRAPAATAMSAAVTPIGDVSAAVQVLPDTVTSCTVYVPPTCGAAARSGRAQAANRACTKSSLTETLRSEASSWFSSCTLVTNQQAAATAATATATAVATSSASRERSGRARSRLQRPGHPSPPPERSA